MRRHMHLLLIALVTAALGIFLPMANAQACPNDGSGEAIQCRMGNVLAKHGTVLSGLQAQISSQCANSSDARCTALQNHLQRAQNAHQRAVTAHNNTSADNYNQLTNSPQYHRKSNCKGGGGGCGGVAASSSGSSQTDTVDTNYDPTVGQTITGSLDDASGALDDASNTLATIPTPTVPPFPTVAVYDFRTDDAYPAWLHPTIDEKVWIPALFAIKLAAGLLEGAHTAAEHACNETLVVLGEGGNVSAACIPLALAVVAFNATAEMMEFVDHDLLYWNAKGGYINAQNAVTAGNQAGQVVTDVATELTAIASYINTTLTPDLNQILTNQAKILANQAYIMQLLITPQGQRPGFPSK